MCYDCFDSLATTAIPTPTTQTTTTMMKGTMTARSSRASSAGRRTRGWRRRRTRTCSGRGGARTGADGGRASSTRRPSLAPLPSVSRPAAVVASPCRYARNLPSRRRCGVATRTEKRHQAVWRWLCEDSRWPRRRRFGRLAKRARCCAVSIASTMMKSTLARTRAMMATRAQRYSYDSKAAPSYAAWTKPPPGQCRRHRHRSRFLRPC